MKKYEVMYIVRPTLADNERKSLIAEISNIVTSAKGNLKANEWGMKDLAYEIEKHKKGFYVVLEVEADIPTMDELDRVIRIKEDIIRHIIINDER